MNVFKNVHTIKFEIHSHLPTYCFIFSSVRVVKIVYRQSKECSLMTHKSSIFILQRVFLSLYGRLLVVAIIFPNFEFEAKKKTYFRKICFSCPVKMKKKNYFDD